MAPEAPLTEGLPAADPAAYPFWSEERIRFADLDLLGHVNNVAFMVYAESGRVEFLRHTGLWQPGVPRNNVVARIELDYRHELGYPGLVRMGLRVLKVGTRSFTLGQGFFSGEVCAATVVATLVRFDSQARQTVMLNETERQLLLGFQAPI